MQRYFDYKGHRFTMVASFNTVIERTPNGRREHTLAVSHSGTANYAAKYTFTDATTEGIVAQAELDCERWVAAQSQLTVPQAALTALGFSDK